MVRGQNTITSLVHLQNLSRSKFQIITMSELHLEKDLSRAVDLLKSLQGNPSLPSDKLKALQDVLESDFLRAIASVYQSIYDTVDVPHSNEEAAAIATAKGRGFEIFNSYRKLNNDLTKSLQKTFLKPLKQQLQHLLQQRATLIQEWSNCQTRAKDLDSTLWEGKSKIALSMCPGLFLTESLQNTVVLRFKLKFYMYAIYVYIVIISIYFFVQKTHYFRNVLST